MRSKNEEVLNKIIEIINNSYFQESETPSMKEIADELNISVPTVCRYITELIERGEIEKSSRFRGVQTAKIARLKAEAKCPVVGEIACGVPLLAEENIESYITLSREY